MLGPGFPPGVRSGAGHRGVVEEHCGQLVQRLLHPRGGAVDGTREGLQPLLHLLVVQAHHAALPDDRSGPLEPADRLVDQVDVTWPDENLLQFLAGFGEVIARELTGVSRDRRNDGCFTIDVSPVDFAQRFVPVSEWKCACTLPKAIDLWKINQCLIYYTAIRGKSQ